MSLQQRCFLDPAHVKKVKFTLNNNSLSKKRIKSKFSAIEPVKSTKIRQSKTIILFYCYRKQYFCLNIYSGIRFSKFAAQGYVKN
ncbi:MAG: hypothetical protein JG782_1778 [Anaerophaga sp.]|nr:hypothetical protein [Anaerophaga sp.]MDI3521219.1 hypothetical protein [Anaerophaga sp.]MDN5291910.1 hypothetical protein [Anaerophaga sp.]